jgi:fructose-1,6-bisphosphatase I
VEEAPLEDSTFTVCANGFLAGAHASTTHVTQGCVKRTPLPIDAAYRKTPRMAASHISSHPSNGSPSMTSSSRAPSPSVPPQSLAVVGTTLREHVLQGMHAAPGATGEFTSLLNHLSLAIRIINSRVRSAGLHGLLGYTGETNVQGEQVQKLDEFSNEVLINVLERSGHCGVIASEEVDEVKFTEAKGKYVVLFDPLDGSSNIDTNVGIGTIFALLRRKTPRDTPSTEDALRPGHEIACAGYALYGPSTVLTLSTGQGVHSFTLDPNIGEFFLSHPNIRCPMRGSCYSINEGNYARWSPQVQRWNQWIKGEDDPAKAPTGAKQTGRPYGHRYVGSLVADAHRTLLKGGIFAYPPDSKSPKGKLRLLYEANPMAFLFEQAGGAATDGTNRILDVKPTEAHQRTPLVIGSAEDVMTYRQFMTGER